ncbi:TRAP transporter small permease [Bordetella petrii]|uniref:TRAP transporter small permease n=1 Tax=Bordetella petrii TaxID=94624 RepID=UPI001A97635C|nr:TRAP transporter small permease [Bordetella petrii]MBO1112839.1 TRAP transporter small permease [Bordetella petrii]
MAADTQIIPDARQVPPPVLDPAIAGETEGDAYSPPEGRVARWGRWIAQALVVALVAMMGVEMVVRSAFGWSIQFSNELGGYALVAITFLSLASGQLQHAYHSVHFLENRLGPRGRARLRLLFDLLAIAVTLVLLLELARFEWLSWKSGDVASTTLMTPLWIPRLAMPLGVLALAWALLRVLAADMRRLRALSR